MSKERVFGCTPSIIDGTEEIFEVDEKKKIELPETYSYIKYLPKVLNQGSRPICVPCSVSAYINYSINTENGENNVNNNVDLNALFKGGDKDGMTIKDCLNNLRYEGVKTDKGMFSINNYARIGSERDLKAAVVANGPCIGAVGVYNSRLNEFWDMRKGNFEGGHAISFVGYDKDGFIIRNSWGPSYGDKGYWLLPYKDLELFYELWTIIF